MGKIIANHLGPSRPPVRDVNRIAALGLVVAWSLALGGPGSLAQQAPVVRESQRPLEILWQFDTGG